MSIEQTISARSLALEVLLHVEKEKAFSNLQLNIALRKHSLEKREIGLATELVYGTLSRLNTLDWMLAQLIDKPVSKLDVWVRCLLRLSLYQLTYLDRIPDHAIVSEAVEEAKQRGHQGIGGLVNGVLREYQRVKDELKVPSAWPKFKRIAIEHSHPEWIVKRWLSFFGTEQTISICETNNKPPFVSIRVNRLKATRNEVHRILLDEFPEAELNLSNVSSDGIILSKGGGITNSKVFKEGLCTVQDESSMLVALALDVKPDMDVLDTCAAPGGKTTHLAERMDNKGRILALDIHEHKLRLIEENANRLGVQIIEPQLADARNLSSLPNMKESLFDRILVDAPCSGFGVIRRKPDLKWNKKAEDISEIAEIQLQILGQAGKWLKPNGKMVYSTCTIDPEENSKVVARFLKQHPEFELDSSLVDDLPELVKPYVHKSGGYVQILPHYFQTDGFFISRLVRNE